MIRLDATCSISPAKISATAASERFFTKWIRFLQNSLLMNTDRRFRDCHQIDGARLFQLLREPESCFAMWFKVCICSSAWSKYFRTLSGSSAPEGQDRSNDREPPRDS